MLIYSNDGYRVLFQGTKIVLNNILLSTIFFFSLQVIIFIYGIYMFSLIFKITINFKTNTIFTHIYTTVYKKKIFTMVQGCVKIIISLFFSLRRWTFIINMGFCHTKIYNKFCTKPSLSPYFTLTKIIFKHISFRRGKIAYVHVHVCMTTIYNPN